MTTETPNNGLNIVTTVYSQIKQQNGLNTEYYDNGQKKFIEGNLKDGKQDGKWTGWYRNGQIRSERDFKDGNIDGKHTSWYENGQIWSERNYKDGNTDGKATWWYENGQIEAV